MATSPTKAPITTPNVKAMKATISVDKNTGKLRVDPDPFWIGRDEEVVWECDLPHVAPKNKHDGTCFTITFQEGGLFYTKAFHGHGSHSKEPLPSAPAGKLFKYSVDASGFDSLDPQGGVKS